MERLLHTSWMKFASATNSNCVDLSVDISFGPSRLAALCV